MEVSLSASPGYDAVFQNADAHTPIADMMIGSARIYGEQSYLMEEQWACQRSALPLRVPCNHKCREEKNLGSTKSLVPLLLMRKP